MSHRALQRAIVRLLFDPALAGRVYAGGSLPGLTEKELAWLRSPDARAWRTDPHRRARSLHALLEELPAAAALSGDPPALLSFFSSDAFHACIEEGGSLALSFGAWLASRLAPPARDVARIETAIADLRRRRARAAPPGRLALSAFAEVLEVDAAAADLHATLVERLGASPVEVLVKGPLPAVRVPAPTGNEAVLVHRRGGDVTVERLPDALAALLAFAREPRTRDALVAEARRLGAGDDAAEIVDSLLADALLLADQGPGGEDRTRRS